MKSFFKKYFFRIHLIVIFFSSLFIQFGCFESPKKETIEIKFDDPIYDENGNLFTGTKKGTVGGKTLEYEVVNGKKHGFYKVTNQNGIVEVEGYIKENKNDSLWRYYYSDGSLESEGYFENDLAVGVWVWYYPTGELKEKAEFENGLRNGRVVLYNGDGSIKSETIFKDGFEIKNE